MGRGLKSDEIIRVLEVLIGGTEPVGDEAVDAQHEENLKTLIDVTNWCLDRVNFAAEHRHSLYMSERRPAERAFGAMGEWHQWLGEQFEEEEE